MAVFVQATFSQEDKSLFKTFVSENIPVEMLYYSPDPRGAHIKGDMTDKLHLTLYYGLPKNALYNPDLPAVLEENIVSQIELGELFLIDGYQGLYKIFSIEVKDTDGKLMDLCEKISYFAWEDKYTERFKPHLTLAYVSNDFEIPALKGSLPKVLQIENVVVSDKL